MTIHPSADVHDSAVIGDGTTIWHLAQVREHAHIGAGCIVGRGAYVDTSVVIGDNCKIQNYALLYAPCRLGSGVFVGPGAVLTNDLHPRAVTPSMGLKKAEDWKAAGVVVGDGASIGAQAVILPRVSIGGWAMIAAGAVVSSDVPDRALVAGVPARRISWISRAGQPMDSASGLFVDPDTGERFRERHGILEVTK